MPRSIPLIPVSPTRIRDLLPALTAGAAAAAAIPLGSIAAAIPLALLALALAALAWEWTRRRALVAALDDLARQAAGEPTRTAHPRLRGASEAIERLRAGSAADRARLRDLAARAFRAQEHERLRIASELQEETAQTLAGLLLRLRVARRTEDAETRERVLEEVRAGLAGATDSVRRYARGLFPPALEDLGVVAAIEAYAHALGEGGRPPITVRAEGVRGVLARDGELALYRAVQEALANAVRHAGARGIRVTLTGHRGGVRAVVQDDGRGFDPEEVAARGPCLGLLALRERALFAGGFAEVSSTPGGGTRVTIDIPGIERRPAAAPALFPSMPRRRRASDA